MITIRFLITRHTVTLHDLIANSNTYFTHSFIIFGPAIVCKKVMTCLGISRSPDSQRVTEDGGQVIYWDNSLANSAFVKSRASRIAVSWDGVILSKPLHSLALQPEGWRLIEL